MGKILEAHHADVFRDPEELDDGKSIPDDIVAMLRKRNAKVTPLSGLRFKAKNVSFYKPVHPSGEERLAFSMFHPNSGWIGVYLPGYSTDGKTAVVHFCAGPTAHIMIGAYMFTRQGKGWKIKWRYTRSVF